LDTAVLIFAVESPERLTKRASNSVRNPANSLELTAVSLVEIAVKASLGKLGLSVETVRQAIHDLGIRVVPFTAEHGFRLFSLPTHHSDPFDRQIIAQALVEDLPVVTPDDKFRLYKGLTIIW
jgi:PIN domain nuclease of toxin-antitoxin system